LLSAVFIAHMKKPPALICLTVPNVVGTVPPEVPRPQHTALLLEVLIAQVDPPPDTTRVAAPNVLGAVR